MRISSIYRYFSRVAEFVWSIFRFIELFFSQRYLDTHMDGRSEWNIAKKTIQLFCWVSHQHMQKITNLNFFHVKFDSASFSFWISLLISSHPSQFVDDMHWYLHGNIKIFTQWADKIRLTLKCDINFIWAFQVLLTRVLCLPSSQKVNNNVRV